MERNQNLGTVQENETEPRTCKICNIPKQLGDFHFNSRANKNGTRTRRTVCKKCHSKAARSSLLSNHSPEQIAVRQKVYRDRSRRKYRLRRYAEIDKALAAKR